MLVLRQKVAVSDYCGIETLDYKHFQILGHVIVAECFLSGATGDLECFRNYHYSIKLR